MVRSRENIRNTYLLDRLIAEMRRGRGEKCKHGLTDDKLRELRQAVKEYSLEWEDEWGFKLVSSDYEDTLWKLFVPGEHFTEEEKKETREEMWIHCMPSQYDCTGQIFTQWIDFFDVPGGTWVYHKKGMDV